MVNNFNSISELNSHYADMFLNLTDCAVDLGLDVADIMRDSLLQAYKRDLTLLNFNEDFELKLKKKELKNQRSKLRLDSYVVVKSVKNNVVIDKKRNLKKLQNDFNESKEKYRLENKVDKKSSIVKKLFRKKNKTENCQE